MEKDLALGDLGEVRHEREDAVDTPLAGQANPRRLQIQGVGDVAFHLNWRRSGGRAAALVVRLLLDMALDRHQEEALGVGLPENLGHRVLDRRAGAIVGAREFGAELAQRGLRLGEPALAPPRYFGCLLGAAHPDDPIPVGGGVGARAATEDILGVALADDDWGP